MNKTKMLNGLMFGVLISVAGTASAKVESETVIDFDTNNPISGFQSYFGVANTLPSVDGTCEGTQSQGCIYQNDMVIGIVKDSDVGAHLHRKGSTSNRRLGYESDSSGIYFRAKDSSAFSLVSMDFFAAINDANPDDGPNDFWEILGFNTALIPDLGTGNGTDYATRVAYQTVANGFSGNLLLNSDFQNINAFWIHYNGYPQTPADGKAFEMSLDNIKVDAAVSHVPVPAAAWLFGTGLLGLISFGRKKTGLSA